MTYKEAESLIIDAYFKDEIKPYDRNFCFCGTIGAIKDYFFIYWDASLYSAKQYSKMEDALLVTIRDLTIGNVCDKYAGMYRIEIQNHPNYENALFEGMVAALNVLREIHIERGENVDEEIEFKKRVIPCVVNN